MKKNYTIYVVEDDQPMNTMLCMFLKKQGYNHVSGFFSSEEMIEKLPARKPVVIVQDFDLPGMNGLETIRTVRSEYPNTEFIFLSGQKSIEIAIESLKNGAYDYIVKDSFAKENVVAKINNLLKIKSLEKYKQQSKIYFLIFSIFLFLSWFLLLAHYFIRNF